MPSLIYVDLDGVLAGFDEALGDFFHKNEKDEHGRTAIDPNDWRRLQRERPTFWADLPLEKYALDLWRVVSRYAPNILSAIPIQWPSADVGKRIWVKRMLPKFGYSPQQQIHIVQRAEKVNFATQPDGTPNILIDDHPGTIADWNAKGGIGIHYIPSSSAVQKVAEVVKQYAA